MRVQLFHSIGTQQKNYGKGVHDLPESLATFFVEQGLGKYLDVVKKPQKPEVKPVEIVKDVQITNSNSSNNMGSKRGRPKNSSKGKRING